MKILITGVCGYVGSRLADRLRQAFPGLILTGIDNLSRRGSETNWQALERAGVRVFHGDVRVAGDVADLPPADWVIDCAANPSVLAGLDDKSGDSSRKLVENNLIGTMHLLEYCRRHASGLVLLSTSRVYSWPALNQIPLIESATRFDLDLARLALLPGVSVEGISEAFSVEPPASLYGMTKRCSEIMALEYAAAFNFPLWINRCGVIAGPGQFGKPDQGVFSFWAYAALMKRPLRYTGFGGRGKQVRDCLLAEDVADLVIKQLREPNKKVPRLLNVGGGAQGSLSLMELTQLCEKYYGQSLSIAQDETARPFDVPFFVTDHRQVSAAWDWRPSQGAAAIVEQICRWSRDHVDVIGKLLG